MQVTSRTAVDMTHLLCSPPGARLDRTELHPSPCGATTGLPASAGCRWYPQRCRWCP